MADSESERSSFTFVMVVAWTFLNINLLCCGFVLYQTYQEWRKEGYKPLSMTHRLPFYNAVTNLILYVVFGVNIFYPAVNLSLWPDPACQLLGFAGVFVICLNMFLIMIIAVAAYFRTRRGKIFDFGYKDYKLFSIVTLLSLGLTLPGYFFEAYGDNTFWCVNHKDSYIGSYVAISVLLCVLMIVIFCYVLLLLSLPHVDGELSEDQVNRSITAYILVSIFQSALLTAYYIYNLSNDQQQLLNFIVLGITININGIGCAVYYGINKYYTKRNNPPPLPKRSRRSRLSNQSSKSSGSRRSRKRASQVVSIGSALEVVYEEPVFMEVVNDEVDVSEMSEMSENTEESSWPD